MGAGDVPRPDAAGEAVLGVVGGGDGSVDVGELHDAEHRTEDLFADHRHRGVGVDHHGRLVEVALVADSLAAGHDPGPGRDPTLDVSVHPVEVALRDEGPRSASGSAP